MKKMKVKINKPIYLGFSILEISKTLMYAFWCDYMKPKYKQKVKLFYTDTDSFICHIKKILLMMLKNGLRHQIILLISINLFPLVKIKRYLDL